MLSQLEPFIGYTPEELNKITGDILDDDTIAMKVNFNDYIDKFENEYILITGLSRK